MEKKGGSKGAQAAEVIDGEGDEGDVLVVEFRDDGCALGGLGGTALEFRADARQVGPEN
jgi:hypothetical protein